MSETMNCAYSDLFVNFSTVFRASSASVLFLDRVFAPITCSGSKVFKMTSWSLLAFVTIKHVILNAFILSFDAAINFCIKLFSISDWMYKIRTQPSHLTMRSAMNAHCKSIVWVAHFFVMRTMLAATNSLAQSHWLTWPNSATSRSNNSAKAVWLRIIPWILIPSIHTNVYLHYRKRDVSIHWVKPLRFCLDNATNYFFPDLRVTAFREHSELIATIIYIPVDQFAY